MNRHIKLDNNYSKDPIKLDGFLRVHQDSEEGDSTRATNQHVKSMTLK